MSKNKQVQKRYKKLLLTLVKLVVSIGLILFVFSKIDAQSTFRILKSISPINLILGFLLILLSKIIASYRLLSYFRVIQIPIKAQTNLQLYFLGMFYNLFLPGGIGGDAYKAYILKKQNPQSSSKRTIAVLVLDRISGLFALFTIGVFVLASLQISILNINSRWSILLLVVALLSYKFIIDKGFAYTKAVFWSTIVYSLFVQGLQVISILFILNGLNISTDIHPYVLVFLCSSIVSVIPLTIGGIGSRELTFVYGAQWFNLSEEKSLGTSMLFFLLNALVSLIGIYYYFNSIEFKKDSTEVNNDKRSPAP